MLALLTYTYTVGHSPFSRKCTHLHTTSNCDKHTCTQDWQASCDQLGNEALFPVCPQYPWIMLPAAVNTTTPTSFTLCTTRICESGTTLVSPIPCFLSFLSTWPQSLSDAADKWQITSGYQFIGKQGHIIFLDRVWVRHLCSQAPIIQPRAMQQQLWPA